MRRPERPSGFFIPDLVENAFGDDWRQAQGLSGAPLWMHPQLLDPAHVEQVRAAFQDGGRVPHVCLTEALQPTLADALHHALERARFVRHHHAPYPLSIARHEQQEPSALMDFVHWLGTDEAAAYHGWLVGWTGPLTSRQVQVSRMGVGEHFPLHQDTVEEGLAVVYNFTRHWDESLGGVLAFPHPSGTWHELRIPPEFNSVFIFHSTGASHEVTQVRPEAGTRWRYSITAFFLAP